MKVRFIAAIQPNRFNDICIVIEGRVQKSGDQAYAIKLPDSRVGDTELLTCFNSPNNKIKMRWTLTNALTKVNHTRRKGASPSADK